MSNEQVIIQIGKLQKHCEVMKNYCKEVSDHKAVDGWQDDIEALEIAIRCMEAKNGL